MAYTPNIFDAEVEPDLDDHDSMVCVFGRRIAGEESAEVVIKQNWPGGSEAAIDCDDEEDAQNLIDAIGQYADRGLVHLVFNV